MTQRHAAACHTHCVAGTGRLVSGSPGVTLATRELSSEVYPRIQCQFQTSEKLQVAPSTEFHRCHTSTTEYRLTFSFIAMLDTADINPVALRVKYAVRGEVVNRANAIQEELDDPSTRCPIPSLCAC